MMTRQKLGDLRDSLMSSVWKNSFKKALNIYPEFDLVSLDFTVPHCDACNLSNRIVRIPPKVYVLRISCADKKSRFHLLVNSSRAFGRNTI